MRRVSPRNPRNSPAGLTLVEVLMSMMVAGIGVLSVIVLFPLSFVRAIQATNLTNGTILRYNAECLADANPNLLLRWQASQSYSNATPNASSVAGGAAGDIVLVPSSPTVLFRCTTSGTSGLSPPTIWNTTVGGTTTDGSVTWTTTASPPAAFVIDPLGWNTLGAPLQTNFGSDLTARPNGARVVDPKAMPRFNGELSLAGTAALSARLPDSWIEQARGPVTAPTANSVTMSGVDLSTVGFNTTPAAPPAATFPLPPNSRVVMLDSTGKTSATRIITGINPATGVVSWGVAQPGPPPFTSDQLPASFTPVSARVETQDTRYTWIFTVHPNPPAATGAASWNVTATVFFNRPQVATDEQVYQATGADGVQTPFKVYYGPQPPPNPPLFVDALDPADPVSLAVPFAKKGGFVFDCYFGRWYRIVNVVNDPVLANTLDVYVDQARPQTDVLTSLTFGVVFMRGVIDQYSLMLK